MVISGIIGGVRDWKSIIDRVGMKLFCIYFTRLREFSEFNCNFASLLMPPSLVDVSCGRQDILKGVYYAWF